MREASGRPGGFGGGVRMGPAAADALIGGALQCSLVAEHPKSANMGTSTEQIASWSTQTH